MAQHVRAHFEAHPSVILGGLTFRQIFPCIRTASLRTGVSVSGKANFVRGDKGGKAFPRIHRDASRDVAHANKSANLLLAPELSLPPVPLPCAQEADANAIVAATIAIITIDFSILASHEQAVLPLPCATTLFNRRRKRNFQGRDKEAETAQEIQSFRKLADELRIQVAVKYLRDTVMTKEDIATAMGFSDPANFRHAFRRWTGKTPGEFRRGARRTL
jgi:hypothetical protein